MSHVLFVLSFLRKNSGIFYEKFREFLLKYILLCVYHHEDKLRKTVCLILECSFSWKNIRRLLAGCFLKLASCVLVVAKRRNIASPSLPLFYILFQIAGTTEITFRLVTSYINFSCINLSCRRTLSEKQELNMLVV